MVIDFPVVFPNIVCVFETGLLHQENYTKGNLGQEPEAKRSVKGDDECVIFPKQPNVVKIALFLVGKSGGLTLYARHDGGDLASAFVRMCSH